MAKELTLQTLLDWGIESIHKEDGDWVITKRRLSGNKYGKKGELQKALIKPITTHHKYGNDKTYMGVIVGGGVRPLHRVLYAWFLGDVPDDMVVDHIDGNSLNNDLDNLQLLTQTENIQRRENHNNQWTGERAKKPKNEVHQIYGVYYDRGC